MLSRISGFGKGWIEVVEGDEAFNGGRSLRVEYPAGSYGSPANGGAQWSMSLEPGYDELYLSYRVKFSADFDFTKGGKLPGLAGGEGNTGGNTPDGTDGWSGRMMWGTGGTVRQYVYHADQPSKYGHVTKWTIGDEIQKFQAGIWYRVEHRIVMNHPGAANGIVQGWLDGKLAMDEGGYLFRTAGSFNVDQFLFSTFIGGGADYAANQAQWTYYDDIVISTRPISH